MNSRRRLEALNKEQQELISMSIRKHQEHVWIIIYRFLMIIVSF